MAGNITAGTVDAIFGKSFSDLPPNFWQAGGDPLSDEDGETTLGALPEHNNDDRCPRSTDRPTLTRQCAIGTRSTDNKSTDIRPPMPQRGGTRCPDVQLPCVELDFSDEASSITQIKLTMDALHILFTRHPGFFGTPLFHLIKEVLLREETYLLREDFLSQPKSVGLARNRLVHVLEVALEEANAFQAMPSLRSLLVEMKALDAQRIKSLLLYAQ